MVSDVSAVSRKTAEQESAPCSSGKIFPILSQIREVFNSKKKSLSHFFSARAIPETVKKRKVGVGEKTQGKDA
jgi:hypothetical protein